MGELKTTNNKIKVDLMRSKPELSIYFRIFVLVSVLIICFGLYFNIFYSGVYIIGDSMLPTLHGASGPEHKDDDYDEAGDYIYVNKYEKPTYGDIVVVTRRDEKEVNGETVVEKTTIVKRVIAMGGDYVRISDGVVSIKYKGKTHFVPLSENYISEDRNTIKNKFPVIDGVYDENGYRVEDNCLFLLGDNRDNSLDSRENGGRSFPVGDVFGVATSWSLNNKKFFKFMHYTFGFGYSFG